MRPADVLIRAGELASAGEPFALATVVNVRRPASARRGDRARRDRRRRASTGWVGGACSEPTVVREALARARRRRVRGSSRTEGVVRLRGRRRGPRRAVSSRLRSWRSSARAPRPSTLARLRRRSAGASTRELDEGADAVVVATMGHGDEEALAAALAGPAGYVGLVASAQAGRRGRSPRCALGRSRGGRAGAAQSTGRPRPRAVRAGGDRRRDPRRARRLAAHARTPVAPPPAEAVDPVCGMTVSLGLGAETLVHDGTTYAFCCAAAERASRQIRHATGRDRAHEGRPRDARALERGRACASRPRPSSRSSAPRRATPAPCSPCPRRARSPARSPAAASSRPSTRRRRRSSPAAPPRLDDVRDRRRRGLRGRPPLRRHRAHLRRPARPELVAPIAEAAREERRSRSRSITVEDARRDSGSSAPRIGGPAASSLARGETDIFEATIEGDSSSSPRSPRGRACTSSALSTTPRRSRASARFLGYRVTVCDARAKFVTPERFPDVDELVVEWPDEFLREAPVDERTAICVLTHDHKFDVPLLKVALETTGRLHRRDGRASARPRRANERLRAEGVTDEQLARIHAPIGLRIGSRTPEEVAVAIAAEIVAVMRRRQGRARGGRRVKLENSFDGRRARRGGLGSPHGRPAHRPVHARGGARRGRGRLALEGDDAGEARPDRAHLRHRRRAQGGRRGGEARRAQANARETATAARASATIESSLAPANGATRIDIVTDSRSPAPSPSTGGG